MYNADLIANLYVFLKLIFIENGTIKILRKLSFVMNTRITQKPYKKMKIYGLQFLIWFKCIEYYKII